MTDSERRAIRNGIKALGSAPGIVVAVALDRSTGAVVAGQERREGLLEPATQAIASSIKSGHKHAITSVGQYLMLVLLRDAFVLGCAFKLRNRTSRHEQELALMNRMKAAALLMEAEMEALNRN